jgi:hypothetical protein
MPSTKQENDGSARAAFASQMMFWWLVQQGLIPNTQAEQMLSQAIRANESRGDEYQVAAAKLTAVLQSIKVFPPARPTLARHL